MLLSLVMCSAVEPVRRGFQVYTAAKIAVITSFKANYCLLMVTAR
jgi:hypothetical protein